VANHRLNDTQQEDQNSFLKTIARHKTVKIPIGNQEASPEAII
jgi:hypothetical protein